MGRSWLKARASADVQTSILATKPFEIVAARPGKDCNGTRHASPENLRQGELLPVSKEWATVQTLTQPGSERAYGSYDIIIGCKDRIQPRQLEHLAHPR